MPFASRLNPLTSTTPMNANITTLEEFESTYALLVRSEEKERSISETVIYLLLILSVVFSIWQVAQQPFRLPTSFVLRAASVGQTSEMGTQQNSA